MGRSVTSRARGSVRTDEIPILKVKAIELVAGHLGIHHVFIDNIGRSLGVIGNALSDLAASN